MKFLQKLAAFMAKWTPAVVTLAAVVAYFVPDAFGWVRGNAQTSLLGLIMLTMGLTLTGGDFRILASRTDGASSRSSTRSAPAPISTSGPTGSVCSTSPTRTTTRIISSRSNSGVAP